MAKQGERSATGSFDYDILNVLTKMQDGISAIKKNTEGQKPYEEARDQLKKSVPGAASGKVVFKLPKLPAGKSILDGLFGIGKLALAGAFLVGLLKDRIIEWFNSMGPDSVGGMIGAALAGLFTKDLGEAPMIERLKSAFKSGLIGAGIGGVIGALMGGPIGLIAGAILGFAAGALWDFLKTDKSTGAQALVAWWNTKTEGLKWAAGLGALAGVVTVLAFGGPIGLVAAAIIGAAMASILFFMSKDTRTDDQKIKAIMDTTKLSWYNYLKSWWRSATDAIGDSFNSLMVGIYAAAQNKTRAVVLEEHPEWAPTPTDERGKKKKLDSTTDRFIESGKFGIKSLGFWDLYNLENLGKSMTEVTIPEDWGYLPKNVRKKLLDNMYLIKDKKYNDDRVGSYGGQYSAEPGEIYHMREGDEANAFKGIVDIYNLPKQYKELYKLETSRGVKPEDTSYPFKEKYVKEDISMDPAVDSLNPDVIKKRKETQIEREWNKLLGFKHKLIKEKEALTAESERLQIVIAAGRMTPDHAAVLANRQQLNESMSSMDELLFKMMAFAKENIADKLHDDPLNMTNYYNDTNQKILDQINKDSAELIRGNEGNGPIIISNDDNRTFNSDSNGSGMKVEPYNPVIDSGRSGFTLQNMSLGRPN